MQQTRPNAVAPPQSTRKICVSFGPLLRPARVLPTLFLLTSGARRMNGRIGQSLPCSESPQTIVSKASVLARFVLAASALNGGRRPNKLRRHFQYRPVRQRTRQSHCVEVLHER